MQPDCFLDTNILFYAAMGRFSDPAKYERARFIIAETHFCVSGQVLQEFFVNVTRKTSAPLSTEAAIAWLDTIHGCPCAAIDHEIVVNAARIAKRYMTSYWDAALIAAAERQSAPILYTEDLNHDQSYGSVRVINPFRVH